MPHINFILSKERVTGCKIALAVKVEFFLVRPPRFGLPNVTQSQFTQL